LVLFLILFAFLLIMFYFFCRQQHFQDVVLEDKNFPSSQLSYENIMDLKRQTAQREKLFLDSDVPAPTNQWFSSVMFTNTSEPIFSYPLAVRMNGNGFGVSYPKIVSTPDTVFGSYDPDFQVVFQEKNRVSSIRSYDDLSVEISQVSRENEQSRLRVTHGSPFVFVSMAPNISFDVTVREFVSLETSEDFLLFSSGGKLFAFFFPKKLVSITDIPGVGFSVSVGDTKTDVAFAVLPNREGFDMFHRYAMNPIVGTRASFSVDGNIVNSRFEILTKNGGDTIFALLPRSVAAMENALRSIGSYQTLRGTQSIYTGHRFDFSRTIDIPSLRLDLSILSDEERAQLRFSLYKDVQTVNITESDTYFLGKKLFALANMLDLTEQLGMREESNLLQVKLKAELEEWRISTTSGNPGKYFYYDPVIRGIVGESPSFGSEYFNDHHFHYGYFIYAASMLARYDSEYLRENELFINLLVKDIANIDRNDPAFPYIRGFDFYEGHSWASGDGLFADGNNQESSSEAVNAWYAVYLWSKEIHHKALQDMSLALYAEESSSALEYWLNIDRTDSRFSNFRHAFVSLLWGGKLDSATWFSPKPEAKLGIQILPLSPGSEYLGENAGRVRENVSSEASLRNPTLFKDYLIAYTAFFDPVEAERQLDALADTDIDSANSRSFLKAWILVKKNKMSNASNL
jgi:endo-1,3(4)-beta-glucanase